MLAIEVLNLSKYYGKAVGVQNLSLSVRTGEILGLLGPNGAGKTTLMRLLTGFLRPSSGKIMIYNRNVPSELRRIKSRMGYLPEEVALYEDLSAYEYLKYICLLRGCNIDIRSSEYIERFQIDVEQVIKEASKGSKQKIAVIQATIHKPDLLILDEPAAGLDPIMQDELFKILLEHKADGKSILIASHNLSVIERICDRVVLIRDGGIIVTESIEGLKKKKLRKAKVFFANSSEASNFLCKSKVLARIYGNCVEFSVRASELNDIIRCICNYKVIDLIIEETSLEEVFLGYYQAKNDIVSNKLEYN